MIRERPILFSGPMVMALLEGRKSQTRRVVKPQPGGGDTLFFDKYRGVFVCGRLRDSENAWRDVQPLWVNGDHLWVRETWQLRDDTAYYTKADTKLHLHPNCAEAYAKQYRNRQHEFGWRPAIHMPRWASRITLGIIDIRVERVQDISEEDAKAEGCSGTGISPKYGMTPRCEYHNLWDSLNAKRGYGWGKNPFVWVIEFKRIKP